ncbi:MAG: phosphoribosylformylglycinamidine cyclo-ligase [candidate division WOR-3 bacterium]|nr:phosphoribosylformylglycinamidine cyclo-ligase [candidate division WOR-3 bacterium]
MLYKEAGVFLDRLSLIKKFIKKEARKTKTPFVLSDIGLFGSLFELKGYKNPVIVGSVDGVGTKILIACQMNKHKGIGEDIVNHCVNDILTIGAKPLFFLDYIAFSEIEEKVIKEVITGIRKACKYNNLALVGGELAQMPDFYPKGAYDLVGFIIGVCEKRDIIDGRKIKEGDIILGLPSSGLHTNGYSLVRKIFKEYNIKIEGLKRKLGEELLIPHKSYLKDISPYLKEIKGIAHITGGGFYENIKRILPKGLSCVIEKRSWQIPKIFQVIQKYGNIPEEEMYRVFNMGIGIVLIVEKDSKVIKKIKKVKIIGEIVKDNFRVKIV